MVFNNNNEMFDKHDSIRRLSIGSNDTSVPPYPGQPDSDLLPAMKFSRIAYNIPQFNDLFDSISKPKTTKERLKMLKPDMSKKAWIRRFITIFPILSWLPVYDFRQNFIPDLVVGVTIAAFQIPQSIAFAAMAHIPPVYGIYTAFFPPLAYLLLGTGSHSAVGAYSITSGLMTGDIVLQVMSEIGKNALVPNANISRSQIMPGYEDITNLDIVLMTGVVIGLYMFGFGILQLGFLSNFLPDELLGGFLTSCSIYVVTSQIRALIGVNLSYFSGPLALIRSYIEIFSRLKEINLITLLISGCCLLVLLIFKLIVNSQMEKRFGIKLPFPIDLTLVIAGTLISSYMSLNKLYGVKIIGFIPKGFPPPLAPKFKLFSLIWARCIPVAIVTYVTTLSVGKSFMNKYGYKLDPNQEMIALGVMNVWGGLFQSLPACSSLPRVALMDISGGKTQVVSIVNCIVVAIVISYLGSLLSPLPSCVIGACIAIALITLVTKIQEAKRFWDISKIDGSIWFITFITVIVLNVDYGFYIGLGCSVILLIYKSQRPKTYLLGSVDHSDIYVPIKKYDRAREIRGIKIYQFCGPLNFADINYFTSQLQSKVGFDVDEIIDKLKKVENKDQTCCMRFRSSKRSNPIARISMLSEEELPTHIIIDCSMFSYIDTAGANSLKKSVLKYRQIGVTVLLSGCAVHVENLLSKVGFFVSVPSNQVYKTIHDAVTYVRRGVSNDYTYKKVRFSDFGPVVINNSKL